jgi:hypothetical protein
LPCWERKEEEEEEEEEEEKSRLPGNRATGALSGGVGSG